MIVITNCEEFCSWFNLPKYKNLKTAKITAKVTAH